MIVFVFFHNYLCREGNFGKESLDHHKAVMKELVDRDKNRPSVIMWSVANEPASSADQATDYFRLVTHFVSIIMMTLILLVRCKCT